MGASFSMTLPCFQADGRRSSYLEYSFSMINKTKTGARSRLDKKLLLRGASTMAAAHVPARNVLVSWRFYNRLVRCMEEALLVPPSAAVMGILSSI